MKYAWQAFGAVALVSLLLLLPVAWLYIEDARGGHTLGVWHSVTFMSSGECPLCHGLRLNARSAAVLLGGLSFAEFSQRDIQQALGFVKTLPSALPATDAVRSSSCASLDIVSMRVSRMSRTEGGNAEGSPPARTAPSSSSTRKALPSERE